MGGGKRWDGDGVGLRGDLGGRHSNIIMVPALPPPACAPDYTDYA